MISNCGHDENNRYSGGTAGDQTGNEWYLRSWYNGNWKYVLRHPDLKVRSLIAEMAVAAAKNDHIGYDQGQRLSFWEQLKRVDYDPAKIAVACEADCSSGVAAIVKGAGYRLGDKKLQGVSIYVYTGNEAAALTAAGFNKLTDSQYLVNESSLVAGDILLSSGHTVIVTTGASSGDVTAGTSLGEYPRKGWTGSAVVRLQTALIAKGYSCGTSGADGSFGPDTHAAVLKYQADNGLEADGIVGPKTQAKLYGGSGAPKALATGTYVTCVGNLRVRTGPGTGYAVKGKSQLTADGQKHSNARGELDKGTTVTVMEVEQVGSDWWGRIPSGWIALYYQGETYANRR